MRETVKWADIVILFLAVWPIFLEKVKIIFFKEEALAQF